MTENIHIGAKERDVIKQAAIFWRSISEIKFLPILEAKSSKLLPNLTTPPPLFFEENSALFETDLVET